MTPWQLLVRLESYQETLHAEHKSKLWHGWHQAYFGRAKKFPDLKKLMKDEKEPSKRIDESDIVMRLKLHNAKQKEEK